MRNRPKCPTTIEWDRYITGMDGERAASLALHLEQCGYCRLVLEERRQFLAAISDIWGASNRPKVISLWPLNTSEVIETGYIPLAAKGESKDEPIESATLASPQKEMLLKVFRDHHTHEVWLYLLADVPWLYDHVIVKPFNIDHEYITDSNGKINLGQIDWPTADFLKAEVRYPEAVFEFLPITSDASDSSATILTTPRGDEIKVMLTGEQGFRRLDIEVTKLATVLEDTPLKIAIREAGGGSSLHVRTLISAKAEFDNVRSVEKLEIYLFQ